MEATKKLNGKAVGKWLSNNAIIMMMLAITLIVGIMHPNFFSGTNMINLFKNVSIRYIIALGISGCLITTGNDLSAGRLAGFAACLACGSGFRFLNNGFHLLFSLGLPLQGCVEIVCLVRPFLRPQEHTADDLSGYYLQGLAVPLIHGE